MLNKAMNLNSRCKDFIVSIGAEATKKTHELSDDLSQDLQYFGVAFKPPPISLPDISTTLRDLGKLAPLLALTPVGWAGAAAFGLFSLFFGDSKAEKIRKAKQSLRESLDKSRDEIISDTGDSIRKIINEDIFGKQIDGFRDKLTSMQQMLTDLSYDQNSVADTLNWQYKDLNFELLVRAAMHADIPPEKFKQVANYRIVGEEFLIVNEGNLSEGDRSKLANLLGEPVTVLKVTDSEQRFSQEHEFVSKKILILRQNLSWTTFVEDETNGDMHLIVLPRKGYFDAKQIQLTQQIFADPVVFLD